MKNIIEYSEVKGKSDFLEQIKKGIWLMNDHKYAFFVWQKYRLAGKLNPKNTLAHIDYHWDGVNDIKEKKEEEKLLNIKSEKEALDFINRKLIKRDSFIAPAVITDVISKIQFYCLQDDGIAKGLDEELLKRKNSKQFFYDTAEELVKETSVEENLLLSIDLDIFNKNQYVGKGDLWKKGEIVALLEKLKPLKDTAILTTIAISPECSGNEEDAEYLFNLCLKHFV